MKTKEANEIIQRLRHQPALFTCPDCGQPTHAPLTCIDCQQKIYAEQVAKIDRTKCVRCQIAQFKFAYNVYEWNPHPAYESPLSTYFFNCVLGYKLAQCDGNRIEMIPHKTPDLENFFRAHEIVEEHIDHVPLGMPVLSGYIYLPEKITGQRSPQTILMDGHHRALKHFKRGEDVPTYVLTPDQMRQIVSDKPQMTWMEDDGETTVLATLADHIA